MRVFKTLSLTAIAASLLFALASSAFAEYSMIVQGYIDAYEANDGEKRYDIVAANTERIPGELDALLEQATAEGVEQKFTETSLYVAELIATTYKDVTGEFEPLRKVKKVQFESKLSTPVRSTKNADGVHIVTAPMHSEERHNYFEPDNIVIKAGDTVRWVNEDDIAHLFASFSIIGKGGLFTPNIDPGAHWEYTFTEPGEYYYLCFIHKGMIGKVTVEE